MVSKPGNGVMVSWKIPHCPGWPVIRPQSAVSANRSEKWILSVSALFRWDAGDDQESLVGVWLCKFSRFPMGWEGIALIDECAPISWIRILFF
jgi:hypothetical protein